MYRQEDTFIADIKVEEMFKYASKYVVLKENENKYIPITDKKTFDAAIKYLLDLYNYQAENNGIHLSRTGVVLSRWTKG